MSGPSKIKVLIVAPAAPMVGGQAIQAARLVEKFRDNPDLQVDLQPVNPQFLSPLQKIKYVRTFVTSTKYFFDLLVRIPRYDVIHIFSASYFSFLLAPLPALLVAKLFRKKTILNYRSGEAEDHLSRSRIAVRAIRMFDKVVTPSNYLVDVFDKFGLTAGSIPNFVDLEKFRFRERNPLRPRFLSNRNFEQLYNVACTLRAFKIIQEKFPDAVLTVAGDGPERASLHTLARELELKNINFTGRVEPEKIAELYDEADIYLNSPDIDNMPNSILEAFAAGTAIVSTNAGGIPYICEDGKTACLVERNDHRSLAEKAIWLLENPATAAQLINAASRECEKYSWEFVETKWKELYFILTEVGDPTGALQIPRA